MPRLSQETLAILGVGIGIAALILTTTAGLRSEMRTEIHSVRTEIQAVRAEIHADREALRAEFHSVRTEARADREAFQAQILRLTEQQGVLTTHVENIRSQLAATQ